MGKRRHPYPPYIALGEVFSTWGAAPSETQRTKSENAECAARKAIETSKKLSAKTIEVFVQGSRPVWR
jgi:hypothetical protein